MDTRLALVTFVALTTGCEVEGRGLYGEVQYAWDDSPVLCSKVVDDVERRDGLTRTAADLDYAVTHDTAALMHAHVPLATVSIEQIACIVDLANKRGVELVTFSDFATRTDHRPALALSFDDESIDAWYVARNVFAQLHARVTFFVAGYSSWTDTQKAKLAELAALGHDVQPHGRYHYNAVDYVAERGIDAYLQDEVLPSIAALAQDGYQTSTYAFPYGATTDAINEAVLDYVPRVRVTRSACPY
jgi:peptidoglycan/xylan/chitin deacetylase (PgdA/CDA1 family)